jgi:hypothetical protein
VPGPSGLAGEHIVQVTQSFAPLSGTNVSAACAAAEHLVTGGFFSSVAANDTAIEGSFPQFDAPSDTWDWRVDVWNDSATTAFDVTAYVVCAP